jgi:transcriptional regulator with XRE-family HTH domain
MSPRVPSYLRRARRAWGLTQRQLALLLGIASRAHISRLESQQRNPSVELLLAFEVLFGDSPKELFPTKYAHIEEEVLRNAALLFAALEDDDCLRAKRIRELLTLAKERAVTSR